MVALLEYSRPPLKPSVAASLHSCHPSSLRRFTHSAVITVCLLLLLYAFFLEAFYVPTGSMAPALRGEHRLCLCPTCANPVPIGKHVSEKERTPSAGLYRKAFCPWCGSSSLPVVDVRLIPGDRVLVNKLAYLWGVPRRWETVVAHLWGEYIIKRILGLPGEELLLFEGDIYVDGALVRKTWAEIEELRVLLFDQTLPGPEGWTFRWQEAHATTSPAAEKNIVTSPILNLDGLNGDVQRTFRANSVFNDKCTPLTDEQAYNGALHASWEKVHDFTIDTEVTHAEGSGTVTFTLFDGQDHVVARIPVGAAGRLSIARRRPVKQAASLLPSESQEEVLVEKEGVHLGRKFHVQFAFVDRRAILRIDGRECLPAVDLPAARARNGVVEPVSLGAEGVRVECGGFRLYRDVHYTQAGKNGVKGQPVLLRPGEYFVLGDNSGRSEDSRYWPDRGAVPETSLVGRVLFRVRAAPE